MTGKEGALSGGKWESNHSQETDGTWTWGSGGDRRSRSRRLRCLCPGEMANGSLGFKEGRRGELLKRSGKRGKIRRGGEGDRRMELGRGVKDGGGNGGNRGIIELRRNGRDSREFADVNAMSSRLVFRPKGSKFRGSHGVGTRRGLKEEKVKWAVITVGFTKGWHQGGGGESSSVRIS